MKGENKRRIDAADECVRSARYRLTRTMPTLNGPLGRLRELTRALQDLTDARWYLDKLDEHDAEERKAKG